ncbi:Rap/ran-GAP family protein [Histomonas meleagridis]|uniref:Rap/ran-GAP family protein n=1 Tax=Histomonas meleagridis TaxID=135588 RepID=UPI0035597904|nr:Rap/ran-GAP family protein [Histomonas meleagridis]KAH0803286.1 Rap/ran-GAP family protein [Histomonas meleagridis]
MTYEFLSTFKGEVSFFCPDAIHTRFFLSILEDIAKRMNPNQQSLILQYLKKITMSNRTMTIISKEAPDLIGNFFHISRFSTTVQVEDRQIILNDLKDFLISFLNVILTKMNSSELVTYFSYFFIQFERDQYFLCSFYPVLLSILFNTNNRDKEIWNLIVDNIRRSELISYCNACFAQYLALLEFPLLFGIDRESTLREVDTINQRIKRNKNDTRYSYFLDNIMDILSDPASYFGKVDYVWKGNRDDSYFLLKPFIQFEENEEIQNVQSMIDFYLGLFDCYKNVNNKDDQIRLYSTHIAYFYALAQLFRIPPSIKNDHIILISRSANRLFNGVMQNNVEITIASFDILCDLLLNSEIKRFLGADSLMGWYSCLTFCLLHSNKDLSMKAFQMIGSTITIGFIGSSILIPTVISYAEINSAIYQLAFFASLPIFENNNINNSHLISIMQKVINKNKAILRRDANDILTKPINDLMKRVQAVIYKITNIAIKEKKFIEIIPVHSMIIVSELVKEKPNEDLVCKSIEFLLSAAESRNDEATLILRDLLITYERPLKNLTKFQSVYNKIIFLISVSLVEQYEYILHVFSLVTEAFIHYPEYAIKAKQVEPFAKRLISIQNDQNVPVELRIQVTLLLTKLAVEFKAYPTTYSPVCKHPSRPDETFDDNNIYYYQNEMNLYGNNIIHYERKEKGNFIIGTYPEGYSYYWEFNSPKGFYEKESSPMFSLPEVTNNTSNNNVTNPNHSFSSRFNDLMQKELQNKKQEDIARNEQEPFKRANERFKTNNSKPKTYRSSTPNKETFDDFSSIVQTIGIPLNESTMLFPEMSEMLKVKYLNKHIRDFYSKIAIVYIAKNKKNQNEILSTGWTAASPLFKEFLSGIGWNIDLVTHYGYDGLFDMKKFTNGKSSIYYADSNCQIMYHVSPLIPNSLKDEQQIYKKRHIGNDHTHIVWCEDNEDYDINMITSQFNMVHIVIYPLQTGLFRVEVKSKSEVGWFGPLRNSIIVTKRELPSLVRLTSISSMVRINETQTPFTVIPPRGIQTMNEIKESIATYTPKYDSRTFIHMDLTEPNQTQKKKME